MSAFLESGVILIFKSKTLCFQLGTFCAHIVLQEGAAQKLPTNLGGGTMKKNLAVVLGAAAIMLIGELASAQPVRRGRDHRVRPMPMPSPVRRVMPVRQAQNIVNIPMYGAHYRGQSTIFLKQEIKQLKPYMDLQNAKLGAVTIVAKSKRGQGTVSLRVGQSQSYPQTIYGHPNDFHNPSHRTYSRIRIMNPAYQSHGAWQINLQGNLKIDSVRVELIGQARGGNKIQLPMYGEHLRGQNTIGVKRLIRNQYGDIGQRNKTIKKVILFAKSKKGRAGVLLDVDGITSYEKTIPGNAYDFHDNSQYTYHRIVLNNPTHYSNRVKLHLRGNIKIDKIVVKFARGVRHY